MRRRRSIVLVILAALCLLAAACGDSDDDSTASGDEASETTEQGGAESTDTTGDEAATTTEATEGTDAGGGASETTAGSGTAPASIEEWEALWEEERQAVVDKIVDGGYGVDDANILTGPGGFEVDLNECPSDYDPTEGTTDTIKIGHTTPQSGPAAAYGDIAVAWEAYIDYVNANGGIDGVPMELIVRDDGYVASQTIEYVDQMLQTDRPFKFTTLGSPNTLAVRENLNNLCIPQTFTQAGLPAWGDPENFPWTGGLQLTYYSEAVLWGQWIEENMADQAPVKVAGLVADNDFGLAYEGGFRDFAEGSDVIGDIVTQQHDPAAATVTNEVTTLSGEDPDVFILMTGGAACTQGVQDAATSGLRDSVDAAFLPSVCKAISTFLEPAGESSDGYYIVGGGVKDITDQAFADEPFIVWYKQLLADAGLATDNSTFGSGILFAWAETEAMRIASMLPGGLTRPNYILAMRSMDMTHPMLFDGVAFEMNGVEDAYFVEGSEIAQFDWATKSYEIVGEVVDGNGQTGTCQWVDGEGCA
jgi:branched-chain amino acid transport system substrate-binding protein